MDLRGCRVFHNPKVGSSSLPRATAQRPALAGLFAVWVWVFGDSKAETYVITS